MVAFRSARSRGCQRLPGHRGRNRAGAELSEVNVTLTAICAVNVTSNFALRDQGAARRPGHPRKRPVRTGDPPDRRRTVSLADTNHAAQTANARSETEGTVPTFSNETEGTVPTVSPSAPRRARRVAPAAPRR